MKLTFRSADGTERSTEITADRVVVGREDADVVLDDEEVSRQHAVIETQSDGRTLISDQGSRNGTYVNGRRIAGPTELRGDETIRLGGTELRISGLRRGGETTLSDPRDRGATRPPGGRPPETTQRTDAERRARIAMIAAAVAGVVALLAIAGAVLAATDVIGGNENSSVAGTTTGSGDDNPIPEIIRAATPATANIITQAPEPVGAGGGSGWVLDATEGYVVTASHVVQEASKFTVEIGGKRKRAELFAAAPCEDIAVLKIRDPAGLEEMPLGSQSALEQGDAVIALGFPLNASLEDRLVATTGIVSQVKTPSRIAQIDLPTFKNLVQTDAAINAGNSGGPLVNEKGELVGMNVASATDAQNENYAIGVDRVKQVTNSLVKGRSLGWSGMNFAFGVWKSLPGMLNLGAVASTPADFERLDEEPLLLDVVTHVNGKRTRTMKQYCAAVGQSTSGDKADYRIVDFDTGETSFVAMAFK